MGDILFTTQGQTALISSDGTGLRYLAFDVPDQETWQASGTFADGRLLMTSREARRDGPGKSFYEYFHLTPTHTWIYDHAGDTLTEVALPRLAPGQTPALLLDDERLLLQVTLDEGSQIYNVALDGTDARPITQVGEGLPYCFSLSPDGRRLTWHLAGPQGYQIWTSDLFGTDRILVAGDPDWLFFGPQWSPDGEWLVYQGCLHADDPGHDWSDLWIARPDGSEQRRLTDGQALWFGASYGPAERPGGGSNVPVWTPDGAVLVSHRTPGARVPWVTQPQRPDVDHFNRDFLPDQAKGGTQVGRVELDGTVELLTETREGVWDFRASASPDGAQLLFCRVPTGDSPTVWVADMDGGNARALTKGRDELGADHPRWL